MELDSLVRAVEVIVETDVVIELLDTRNVRICYQFETLFEQPATSFIADLRSLATNDATHERMCGSTSGSNGAVFNWGE